MACSRVNFALPSYADRCSFKLAVLDTLKSASVTKVARSTVALSPLYTSERVSLSLVLRVALCHGGWYEKWRRATLERPRPEGSRNSFKQIVFPHGYLARSLSASRNICCCDCLNISQVCTFTSKTRYLQAQRATVAYALVRTC